MTNTSGGPDLTSFDLTPAETKVALAIAEGKKLELFALENDISLHTVRNQLKSVFRKTKVSRQIELVILLLNTPK